MIDHTRPPPRHLCHGAEASLLRGSCRRWFRRSTPPVNGLLGSGAISHKRRRSGTGPAMVQDRRALRVPRRTVLLPASSPRAPVQDTPASVAAKLHGAASSNHDIAAEQAVAKVEAVPCGDPLPAMTNDGRGIGGRWRCRRTPFGLRDSNGHERRAQGLALDTHTRQDASRSTGCVSCFDSAHRCLDTVSFVDVFGGADRLLHRQYVATGLLAGREHRGLPD